MRLLVKIVEDWLVRRQTMQAPCEVVCEEIRKREGS